MVQPQEYKTVDIEMIFTEKEYAQVVETAEAAGEDVIDFLANIIYEAFPI